MKRARTKRQLQRYRGERRVEQRREQKATSRRCRCGAEKAADHTRCPDCHAAMLQELREANRRR